MENNNGCRWFTIIAAAIIIATCLLLASCSFTRKVDKEKHIENTKIDSTGKSEEKTIGVSTEEKNTDTKATIDFLTNENEQQKLLIQEMADMINEAADSSWSKERLADSLKIVLSKIKPCDEGGTIKKNNDGSIEIKGIRKIQAEILEELRRKDSIDSKKTTEATVGKTIEKKDTKKEAEAKIKPSFVWLISVLIIGLVLGYASGNKFPITKK